MKHRRQRLISSFAAAAIAGSLACGLGAAPAMAAPAPAAVTTNATAPDAAPAHALKGTSVWFVNATGSPMTFDGKHIGPGGMAGVQGNSSSGDDVATTIGNATGQQIKLYGHNPLAGEAYLQFEGTKVYHTTYLQSGGMAFQVKWNGDSGWQKKWSVTAINQIPYAHEFIHRTDHADGTKGTVVNESSHVATVRLGGQDLRLQPGQSLLFFDAHPFGDGDYGIDMGIVGGDGQRSSAYRVKATDPITAWWPRVEVRSENPSRFDSHDFSEGEARGYHWGSQGEVNVSIVREHDGRMDVPFETSDTSDWARFTITIADGLGS